MQQLVLGAVLGALSVMTTSLLIDMWRRRKESHTLLVSLVAELRNIVKHYRFVELELPGPHATDLELRKHLAFARYGEVGSARNFDKFGFLDIEHVLELLQLSLRVRNNDTFFKSLDERFEQVQASDLEYACDRARYVRESATNLLGFLAKRYSWVAEAITTRERGGLRA
ncbi:MAG TPA: hypothetical protein VLC46_09730 [Thermoanaerobaculia bacterium]|nr:hypothetical protein [Thermoanaerobaculia bacterium]